MNKKIKPDSQTLFRDVRDLFTTTQTMLNGMLDKVPAELKDSIVALKQRVDAKLAALSDQPTDQVPAASEAAYAMQHLCSALEYYKELYDGAISQLNEMMTKWGGTSQQLNSLNLAKEKGELLDKAQVEEKVKTAVNDALTKERARITKLNDRRQLLSKENLPIPAQDETIAGEDAAFNELRTTAQKRVEDLKAKGLFEGVPANELAELCYGSQAQYDRTISLALKMAGKRGSEGQEEREPLAGGSAAGAGLTAKRFVAV